VEQQEPEFVTQIEDNEDMLDAFHNESPVRYQQMDSVIGKDLPVPGQTQRVLPPGRVQENSNSSPVGVSREHLLKQIKIRPGAW
jgi:hypothetical protein